MDKFIMHVDDCWDLDAVVRGHTSRAASSSATYDMVEWFNSFIDDEDDDPLIRSNSGWDHGFPLDDFPAGFSETTLSMVYDELKGLCNDPAEMLPASPKSAMVVNFGSTANNNVETSCEGDHDEKLQEGAGSSPAAPSTGVDDAVHVMAKYKRRKNQQKQVVKQLAADGISSDLWAWRKYGQKPIKGSTYPRSYYRCSSSKGCVARKQVERSTSKPGMFIVTYTGEHSHTQPTRRSALAGITRPSKFSATKKPTKHETPRSSLPKSPHEMSSDNHDRASPTSTSTLDDGRRKLEAFVWGESGKGFNEIMNPPSLVSGEELFLGFDELEGLGKDFALTGVL